MHNLETGYFSRSSYDRGAADRYYGRAYSPHYHSSFTDPSAGECFRVVTCENMTDQEMYEYKKGWNEELDRKEWGEGVFAPQQANRN